jgi:predicted O-methyltransferase YrrM
VPHWLKGSKLSLDREDAFLSDKLVSLNPTKCELCYVLCAALKAKTVVEVGTSFGVSTIYLAAAVRENGDGTGRVIGTEIDPAKARKARANFVAAGIENHVELREGDALQTLKELQGPIDFVLIDTWIPVAYPALKQLTPLLRPGAIVVCDNTKRFRTAYREYLNFINDSSNGFRSLLLPYAGGLEIAIKI